MQRIPFTRDLVLIGGGHTHALVLRRWGMNPLPGARVTLINPGPTAPYSGMLPGFVAGHYTRDELDIDLVKLARFAGARLINGPAVAIDQVAQTVSVPEYPPIAYDTLAIDIGVTSTMPDLPGFDEHAVPAKPLGVFATCWDDFRKNAKKPHVVIIGGGVAGAELAMAMSHALRDKKPTVHIVEQVKVLSNLGPVARRLMLNALRHAGINLIDGVGVAEITGNGVLLSNGQTVRSDFTTGAAGAKPHDWIGQLDVELHDGFIAVNAALQSSAPNIFATGDCAHLGFDPRPKAGVYAVRQAPVLYDNLRATLSGGDLRPYQPQRDYLKLISLGEKSALAEKFGTARRGAMLWKLKDHIDRKFMDQFANLPTMITERPPRAAALGVQDALGNWPMCGGCGAKAGRTALKTVLTDTFGDDAAMVQPGQVMTTDHLRALTHDPVLMARVAANHALGDIWAMAAAPQAATASIILPPMARRLQERTLAEIMHAAGEVMANAGARIIGGHTSLGDELTIGFTITGLAGHPIALDGARPGDLLILTKPIGSGTIMAAEMVGKARGEDVIACLAQMTQSQAAAAGILRDAHAMTDVTGFGLAGHLRGICDMSGVGARLDVDAIPTMRGAAELAAAGVRSSLFDDNKAGAGSMTDADFDLLYDPQTAGGLLAAVDPDAAATMHNNLVNAGYQAAVIGKITEGPMIET